jgi:hypothetical protein
MHRTSSQPAAEAMTDQAERIRAADDTMLERSRARQRAASPASPASMESLLASNGGGGTQLARELLKGLAHGTFPAGGWTFSEWLAAADAGTRATIASAFAHFPCFACRNGLEACDACTGSGFVGVARVCGACVGIGTRRCDFCSGTGLAAYSAMPVEVWNDVLRSRASRAAKFIGRIAQADPAALSEAAAINQLQDLNKLLGVLENALMAARQLGISGELDDEGVAQFVKACAAPASKGLAFLTADLRRLGELSRDAAQRLEGLDADNADAKAEFYAELADATPFEGTGIAHPFLLGEPTL